MNAAYVHKLRMRGRLPAEPDTSGLSEAITFEKQKSEEALRSSQSVARRLSLHAV